MANVVNFVIKTAENFFDVLKLTTDQESEDNLNEFIHNSQLLLLQTFIVNSNNLCMSTNIIQSKNKSLVFYKSAAQDLTGSNSLSNINIVTLSDTPSESLYQVLKHIYSPLLVENNEVLTSNIQQNLSELESNLRIVAHKINGKDKCNVIISIDDEEDYWRAVAQSNDGSKKDREAASRFCELFEDISEEIKSMDTNTMSDNKETVENIGGLLDDVWRLDGAAYPQDRMKHLFDVIGHKICSTIQTNLVTEDLWKVYGHSKDAQIILLLSDSLQVVQTWTSACLMLTETYWPHYALHSWSGKSYVPRYCYNFKARLVQILDVRSSHNQLNKLLTPTERAELKTDQLFSPFQNINVWNCNGDKKLWEGALAKFTANFMPAETKVAEKLKPRLHNTSTKQMLYEFMRYKSLIIRPIVKRALTSELEIFVTSLGSLLNSVKSQIEDENISMYQPIEMSVVVRRVQWAKQMESKVKDIHSCAEKYLNEFEGSGEVLKLATQVMKELKNLYTQLYEDWSRDLQAQVKTGTLKLSLDKPVVEFSEADNMMVVNFSGGAEAAAAEARGMTSLGFPPPPAAAAALLRLARLLHHARYLQQVASFHNTMGERMIPSTRPMMLQAALDLSSLVQDQKAVYWDNEEQVKHYANQLKQAVIKLESQNSYLTSKHVAIRNIVASLVDTELLAKQAEWKKKVKEIRELVETVESNGYKNSELWRSHWDWQLYKALECQYTRTLTSLHKHFPLVKVDLVLQGQRVRVRPPAEELRVQHYSQLRRFVAMPANFVPLQPPSAAASIFPAIVDKHSWLGNKSVGELEASLAKLEALCGEWTRRAALACVPDLGQLCDDNLRTPEDWEVNFKACKAYGQAVAKMTFEDEKIDWIVVGTTGLRRELEAASRALWTALLGSLRASCRRQAAELETFVASATLTLEHKIMPKNAKELAEISAQQQALQEKIPEMENTVEELKKKEHLLRTWGGDAAAGGGGSGGALSEWRRVHQLLASHQQMFQHQAEIVKSSLNGEWENLNTSVEAWLSRWTQTRSQFESTLDVSYEDMRERCRLAGDAALQWDTYYRDKDDLIKESAKFNLQLEAPDAWGQAGHLIAADRTLWSPFKEYDEEFQSLAAQEWVVFQKKLHLLDEFVVKWNSRLEPFTTVTLFMQQELKKYTDLTPLLKYVRGNEFSQRHWREVFALLGTEPPAAGAALALGDFLAAAAHIKKHVKALQKISASASAEAAIRSALNELELWFAGARLPLAGYRDKGRLTVPIVKDFKEILAKIEEHQWVVWSVRGGEGGGAGGDAAAAWDARLRTARRLLRAMHHAQRRWVYLEPILSTEDGDLGTKFRRVDQGFRQVARTVENDPRLSSLLQSARLQPTLDSISEQLVACQSALNQYIDEKRIIFPRLYFLSDDDLLDLLGQARAGAEGRELVMQNHLKKLFPGITGVKLGPDGISITALCSQHGETFQLEHSVDIDCAVEVWLKNLESEMRSSLKSMTLKCLVSNSLQDQDPYTLPTQILCLAQNVRFTEQAEKAISSKELHKLKSLIEKENLYYVESEVEDDNERNKRQALILQCVYYNTVIKTLIDNNVTSNSDWLWQKQLRFYLLPNKEVVAKMGLAQVSYSYEYLGVNTGQFVRTELADECFLILTQALHLGLVGNPFGPAGTGKTESVKALGGLFGRLVLVFNCDEAVDALSMGRLLTGLALCGAWGCFDEFNRLSADTLAAVSHQLSSLLEAMSAPNTEASALLNGKQVKVSPWCGVAATMNPIGRGYGGRRALPAALARVLRPVAMERPRGRDLAAHLLAARALPAADVLAQDLHAVFSMASDLLVGEQHYDWGLRALKAAVGSLGAALAAPGAPKDPSAQRAALCRVLRLNNRSKLTHHDALRFESILSMVFSDINTEDSTVDPITAFLESAVQSLGLVSNKVQLQKCTELHEQLQQRMGVVIVGPPGSGKSTIRRILKTALSQQGRSIVEHVICPKAMSRQCLLGSVDADTRQWTDGVISATALEVSNQTDDVWSWVVCDGDVDPEWVEALNSVLDDNRLLTLPSGWRVHFPPNVNFLFETHTLTHASPATVSRLGVILLSEENSCAQDVLNQWVGKAELESEMAKMAVPLLQRVVTRCLAWLDRHPSDLVVKTYHVSLVKQILTQFEYESRNALSSGPEELVRAALRRSVVARLKHNALDAFQQEMSTELGGVGALGREGEEGGLWPAEELYLSRRLAACEPAVRAVLDSENEHLLIIGPDSSAKNILTEYVLKSTTSSVVVTIDCTPVLEPADIIEELKRNNVAKSGSRGGSATLFVRGLHRARRDNWQSSPVAAMLLQIIQHGGFWEPSGAEGGRGVAWGALGRLRVLATSQPAPLCVRLAAALHTVTVPEPEEDELLELARNNLRQKVDKNIQEADITSITSNMLAIYKDVSDTFHSHVHYKWTACDLKRWCDNVKWYSPGNTAELVTALKSEANCIFKDRLTTDREKSECSEILNRYLREGKADLYYTLRVRAAGVFLEAAEPAEWGQAVHKIINQCITEHEHSVFGDSGAEVSAELAVLCPAIAKTLNGGVAVAAGGAGAGRAAAARVVAAALAASLFFVNHSGEFNTQFKNAISSSGSDNNRTLVFITESAVNNQSLGKIEALLRARSVFAIPREMMPSLSHSQSPTNFIESVKQNLGIIISLDKSQSDLMEYLEKYPLLYNDSHMLWLPGWSEATLRAMPSLVAQRLAKENILEEYKEESNDILPVEDFVKIYQSLESECMRAPCRYVNFIKTYYNIVKRKKAASLRRQNMLLAGVEALRRARSSVAELKAAAGSQRAELGDKQAQASQALDQISATVRAATDSREEMHALKANIELENQKLQIRKKEIEAELASVEPVIAAARAAVGDIKTEALSEVRSLRAPPDVVRDVLEGVLRLMGIADTSWHSMKSFLSKRGVKEDIRCLDASQISPEAAASVQKLLERRGASFEEKVARRASAACAPLAAWVRANLAYCAALQRVQPLQREQRTLASNLGAAEAQLSALSDGLVSVDGRVAALKQQLGQHSHDAAALELRLAAAADTLAAAEALLGQLAHEYDAWERDLLHISQEILELNSRSLLAAAYIVYLPDVTEPEARSVIASWSGLIGFPDPSFAPAQFLASAEKQLGWQADGLPLDSTALKNAVFIDQILEPHKCGLTPLVVDPDGDAEGWLRRTLGGGGGGGGGGADFVSQQSDQLSTAVQYAARLGRILVITEVDSVHSSWAPLLRGLPIGGATTKIILYTRDATLPARLPPQYAALMSLVNFTARVDGLTDQLVHYALQEQNPEVNEKTKEIRLKKATLQKQQHELQENLLRDLSSNSDILHDANLLASLNKTRATTTTIAEALGAARELEAASDAACVAYEPSARQAAQLTLAVKQLTAHRPLVALPVDAVLDVYVEAVKRGGSDPTKLNSLEVARVVRRRLASRALLGLRRRERLAAVQQLLRHTVPPQLWKLFIGSTEFNENQNNNDIKRTFPWLTEDATRKLSALETCSPDLFKTLKSNAELLKEFEEKGDLNIITGLKLENFEIVLAVSIFRPASLNRAAVAFVEQVLGAGVMAAGNEIQAGARWGRRGAGAGAVGAGAGAPRPLLLLGAHAADQLASLAAALTVTVTQTWIDSGRTEWDKAIQANRNGWVALVVGSSPFSPELQAFITNFPQTQTETFDPEFRFWIVSEDRDIPPLVSNACVNIILEPPEGIKNNVLNTLSAWGAESGSPRAVRALAGLALLHALLQERRAYIPEGWSRWYDFSWGDVWACGRGVRALGGGAAARGLVAALYGGRVHARADRSVLAALVHDCLGDHTMAHAWRPRGTDVQLPFGNQLQAYASALSGLPTIDTPEMLGLPADCRAAGEARAAAALRAALRELNTAVGVNKKTDSASTVKPLLALWKRLMAGNPLLKNDHVAELSGWWGAVAAGEARRGAAAARAVHAALGALARGQDAQPALNKVPEEWQAVWEGPESPEQYVKEVAHRAAAAADRLSRAQRNSEHFPAELDLRALFSPRRALCALRARCAELRHCSPDALALKATWDPQDAPKQTDSEVSVVLVGLQLCGAEWARGLTPAGAGGGGGAAPRILLQYVKRSSAAAAAAGGAQWAVPLFASPSRATQLARLPAPLGPNLDAERAALYAVALVVPHLP